MAKLKGPAGNYLVPSLGYLTVGRGEGEYEVDVPDYAIADLLAIGFTLIDGQEPAPVPVAEKPPKKKKSAILTTDSYNS